MELIIDFYKGLDTLNLIIFWGIIIVIILLLVFSSILINKNKKLKTMVEKNNNKYEEELPIKKEELKKEVIVEKVNNQEPEILPEEEKEPIIEENIISKSLEPEKKFIAEEHIMGYNKEQVPYSNIKNNDEQKEMNRVVNIKSSIELPTGPYQRNVLREMSLSQTSPIGINRQVKQEDKKIEMAQDLEDSLTTEEIEVVTPKEEIRIEPDEYYPKEVNEQIKKELTNIENTSPRKTEINSKIKAEPSSTDRKIYEERRVEREIPKTISEQKYNVNRIETPAKELLNIESKNIEERKEKSSSEKYLEEVSRKLAEAEIPDEIERTNYELKQEEDAIISYKELMEKKDSIQTIDEEDAIISIEELMERSNRKQEEPEVIQQESKLYKLSDEEENDNFINELKQFRNDL